MRVTPNRFRDTASRLRRSLPKSFAFAIDVSLLAVTTSWVLARRWREYDVIHCFTANWLSFMAIVVGTILRKPTILELTLLGRDDPGAQLPDDWLRLKSSVKRLQSWLADAIICISPALANRCAQARIPPDKIHLVPRAVDPAVFRPAREGESVRLDEELGLDGRWPVLLFVGGVSRRKGADLLIPVMSRIVREHPRALLLIIGTHDEPLLQNQMETDANRLALTDSVRFIERTGLIDEFMRAATVFLLPTRREGFANVIVEAMATRLPVVVRMIPGITDFIVNDGEDGILVEGGAADSFAEPILELLRDESLRDRIGSAAADSVRRRFSPENIDKAYDRVYQSLRPTPSDVLDSAASALHVAKS